MAALVSRRCRCARGDGSAESRSQSGWAGLDELGSELEQVAEIRDPETWELLRSEEFELLEVLEILEAWDGVQES